MNLLAYICEKWAFSQALLHITDTTIDSYKKILSKHHVALIKFATMVMNTIRHNPALYHKK
ncbi:hypothetical protein HMPREF0880_02346 [Yokenella regensburgei ATCC 43003]|nr:hypothetical protein HMPREF0880_02346 [Yokenella regensburgei ATCC 43003]